MKPNEVKISPEQREEILFRAFGLIDDAGKEKNSYLVSKAMHEAILIMWREAFAAGYNAADGDRIIKEAMNKDN